MAVNPTIENFAFALFRKLWIRNGLPDYAEMVPDYPVVPERDCPDDFCDTVFAFQCFSSSFFEELCKEEYDIFAHSRSDFVFYLSHSVMYFRENMNYIFGTISLAVVTAEMGIACARRDNDIFIFTCPLAFAMMFEQAFGPYLNSVGHRAFWGGMIRTGSAYLHVRSLAGIIGRSASLRRDLIYRLMLLSLELHGHCPERFYRLLENVTRMGALMDNSEMPTKRLSLKYHSSLKFPLSLEGLYRENFGVYLTPMYAEGFLFRHHCLRKCIFQEIASLSLITDEESQEEFLALYEESVFGERAVIPPQREIISDSSSALELHDLDPNFMVSREIHVVDRDPDNRDAACRHEKFSGIISDNPSLYELYDLQPKDTKSPDPQDHFSLDVGNTEHRTEGHSVIVSEGTLFNELNNLKPKDLKSRDTHDVYGLEARDVKHTEEHSSHEFKDVQSNALMESLSKVEEKMRESYDGKSSRTLDIFYKLRNMTDSQVSVDHFEKSELPRSSSDASETKDQEVAIDTRASKFKDQEVAIDTDSPELKDQEETTSTRVSKLRDQGIFICTNFELTDSEISDDVNRDNPEVKNQGISISSKLNDQERGSDTGDFENLNRNSSQSTSMVLDSSDEETLFYDCQASVFDIFSEQYLKLDDKNETSFVDFSKNITSPSDDSGKLKRADETDNQENSNFNASEIRDQKIVDERKSAFECKVENMLSIILDHPLFDEDSGDFESLNRNSSQSTSMVLDSSDEEALFHDCQASGFDIFSEQYLKLDKNETPFGDCNTLKLNENEVIDENCFETEEVLKEPVSSDLPFIMDVYSIKTRVEALPQIESSLETSPDSSANSVFTVGLVETYSLEMADGNSNKVFQSESKSQSESPKEATESPLELPMTKANILHVEALEQQYESLMEKANDCCKIIDGMSGIINEEQDKSDKGGKKRKNNKLKKKNKEDTGKKTEEPTILENGPEKSEIIESDVYQLILVMGTPFKKPIKREGGFMDRITIKSI